MENHKDIPEEIYGKWWKVVNEHFGEIIAEETEEETANKQDDSNSTAHNQQTSNKQQRSEAPTPQQPNQERLSREEGENLTDYLKLGMSIRKQETTLKKNMKWQKSSRESRKTTEPSTEEQLAEQLLAQQQAQQELAEGA